MNVHAKLQIACVVMVTALFGTAAAQAESDGANEIKMIYNVDPIGQCLDAARDGENLRSGLHYCDEALSDPAMLGRAGLLIDRGIVKFKSGNAEAALVDFDNGVAADPASGNAYLNRAAVLIALHRDEDARPDVDKAIALGAPGNMHIAYYSRAVIEDDAGNYQAAYKDYQQALAVKPDYAPASRELRRFRTPSRTASNAAPRSLLQ